MPGLANSDYGEPIQSKLTSQPRFAPDLLELFIHSLFNRRWNAVVIPLATSPRAGPASGVETFINPMRFFDRRGATSLSVSGSEFHDPNLGMIGNPEIMANVLVNDLPGVMTSQRVA